MYQLLRILSAIVPAAILFSVASPAMADDSSWRLSATATPSGSSTAVAASFGAPSWASGTYTLDIQIFDAMNVKVKQWWEERSMSGGQTITLRHSLDTTQVPIGSYLVKLGVWGHHFSPKYAWNNAAAAIRVGSYPAIPPATNVADPLSGTHFYGPNAYAAAQADEWRSSRPGDAAIMERLANTPTARWFSGADADVAVATERLTRQAEEKGTTPVLVMYNIVDRDCGNHSRGGVASESQYIQWARDFAWGIGNRKAVVIVEPDALAQGCGDMAARYRMFNAALDALAMRPRVTTYLDAGAVGWQSTDVMASRLKQAGIHKARGFSLNVASTKSTSGTANYGRWLSSKVNNKHFVMDTSRNGNGSNGEWCNPLGRANGAYPTTDTGNSLIDAFLWIKTPGISDGPCNDGPSAGKWWGEYALQLAKAA